MDLQWFAAWGRRIEAMLDTESHGRLAYMLFRPDERAREAMIRLGVRFPQAIGQVREYLDQAEWQFTDLTRLFGCPACGSQDVEDRGSIRYCWACHKRAKVPSATALANANESFADALYGLQQAIRFASEAIEQEQSPQTEWSSLQTAAHWRKVFKVSQDKLARMVKSGAIHRHPDDTPKLFRIDRRDLPPGYTD